MTGTPGSGVTELDTYDPATNTETRPAYTVSNDADNRFTGISPAYPGTLGTTFVYNNAGRLTQVKNASGTVLGSYLYDEFGQRIVKTVGGTNTFYNYDLDGNLLEEDNGSGSYIRAYVYIEGRPVAALEASGGVIATVHSSYLGAPQVATDSTGAIKWSALYNPYGDTRTLTSSGSTINLRYPGQVYDAETGFYQNWHREYVPQWGRYLEEDPLGRAADENIRAYVSNRPTSATDPTGMEEEQSKWSRFTVGFERSEEVWGLPGAETGFMKTALGSSEYVGQGAALDYVSLQSALSGGQFQAQLNGKALTAVWGDWFADLYLVEYVPRASASVVYAFCPGDKELNNWLNNGVVSDLADSAAGIPVYIQPVSQVSLAPEYSKNWYQHFVGLTQSEP